MDTIKKHSRKVVVAVVGSIVLLVGIIAIPYPGPGWLIVFAGLAILATEFTWAQRILDFAKDKYDRWQDWLLGQPTPIKIAVLTLTGLVVVVTIWLVNGFGIVNGLLNLRQEWLVSPFVR